MYKTKNFKDILEKNHWYTDTGFLTLKSLLTLVHKISPQIKEDTLYPIPRPLSKIELKDRAVQKKLDEKYSSYIGIHIRRGNGVNITKEVLPIGGGPGSQVRLMYSDQIHFENLIYNSSFKNNYLKNAYESTVKDIRRKIGSGQTMSPHNTYLDYSI